jgi:hypothetical protein
VGCPLRDNWKFSLFILGTGTETQAKEEAIMEILHELLLKEKILKSLETR